MKFSYINFYIKYRYHFYIFQYKNDTDMVIQTICIVQIKISNASLESTQNNM